jgi:hypothetical protein
MGYYAIDGIDDPNADEQMLIDLHGEIFGGDLVFSSTSTSERIAMINAENVREPLRKWFSTNGVQDLLLMSENGRRVLGTFNDIDNYPSTRILEDGFGYIESSARRVLQFLDEQQIANLPAAQSLELPDEDAYPDNPDDLRGLFYNITSCKS